MARFQRKIKACTKPRINTVKPKMRRVQGNSSLKENENERGKLAQEFYCLIPKKMMSREHMEGLGPEEDGVMFKPPVGLGCSPVLEISPTMGRPWVPSPPLQQRQPKPTKQKHLWFISSKARTLPFSLCIPTSGTLKPSHQNYLYPIREEEARIINFCSTDFSVGEERFSEWKMWIQ